MRTLLLLLACVVGLPACGANLEQARRRAEIDHACTRSAVVRSEGEGVWIKLCGWNRYYVRTAGGWVEDRAQAFEDAYSEPTYSGSSSPPSTGGAGGPVHVNGYYRRDGTYVHSHSRRRPSRGRPR